MGSVRYWIQPSTTYHSSATADAFYFDVNGLNCFIQRGIPREKSYAESVRGMFFSKSPVEIICSVEWEGCEIGESVPVTVKVSDDCQRTEACWLGKRQRKLIVNPSHYRLPDIINLRKG